MNQGTKHLFNSQYGLQSKILFQTNQIQRIQKRFNQFAQNKLMNIQTFKKSMGLLGIGQCQFLCNRIFPIITQFDTFDFDDFLVFLNTITYGSKIRKAKISFDFLDKNRKGYINYNDIEIVISQISFIWNFLTGQKISNSDSIALICNILGITQNRSISFQQYIDVYDNYIQWYDYFNSQISIKNTNMSMNTNMNMSTNMKKHIFNVDQIQQYLKMLYSQIQIMIEDLRESDQTQQQSNINILNSFSQLSQINSSKGPNRISFQQLKPKGDFDNPKDSLNYYRASYLSKGIKVQGNSKIQIASKKLQQFTKISGTLFPHYHNNNNNNNQSVQNNNNNINTGRNKKKALVNITQPDKIRKKIIYFGHQNWNIMLNMMLGIRKSIKSYFYKFNQNIEFTSQDLNCKYTYQLIYKQNNKSLKQISQIFIDYSPKIFFYIRCYFKIQNNQFLKSIGLQNLIGNLLMGNLTSLTDQTSQGKSGSFFYYTQDSKLIVRSISKQQYLKLRQILNDYTQYIKQNPQTFLLHIYGLYKLKNKQTNRQIYFIIVNNFFQTSLKITQRYDIKGSTHNRQSKTHGINTALKDVDLINNQNRHFIIQSQTKQKIYKQIIKDSEFLCSHNITDYSLLIGISKQSQNISNISKGYLSQNKQQTYFFGIIDILTQYSTKKVLENHFLHLFVSDISCLAPQEYYERFKNFIYKNVFCS